MRGRQAFECTHAHVSLWRKHRVFHVYMIVYLCLLQVEVGRVEHRVTADAVARVRALSHAVVQDLSLLTEAGLSRVRVGLPPGT